MSHITIFDLDDTLYPERSYVLSGFNAVPPPGYDARHRIDTLDHLVDLLEII